MGWKVSNLALIKYAIATSYNAKMVIKLTTKKLVDSLVTAIKSEQRLQILSSYPSAQFCPKC